MKGEVIQCEGGRIVRDLGSAISIFIPMEIRRQSGRKVIIPPDAPANNSEPTPLQVAFARAYVWQKWLDEGKFSSAQELADHLSVDASFVRRMLRLGSISPRLIESALQGKEPPASLQAITEMELPLMWEEHESHINSLFPSV